MKKQAGKMALVDVEIMAYQVCLELLQEERNSDDEWTYKLDHGAAVADLSARVHQVTAEAGCSDATLAIGCVGKPFRCHLDPSYKAHRTHKKPLGYRAVVEEVAAEFGALQLDGLEADDVLALAHTNPKKAVQTVLISEDKDLRSVPGAYYDPRSPTQGVIEIDKAEADVAFYTLALKGDTSDGFKGCPGCGEKGALAALMGCRSEEAMWAAVVERFEAAGLTRQDALLQARLARVLRHGDPMPRDGYWVPPGWQLGGTFSVARSTKPSHSVCGTKSSKGSKKPAAPASKPATRATRRT